MDDKAINEYVDNKLKEVVLIAMKGKFLGKNTVVNIEGIEYYVMFSYRPIPPKCEKCGQDLCS